MLLPIGFCGYGRVGKDSAYLGLKNIWRAGRVYRLAFADPIKEDVQACLNRFRKCVPGFNPEDDTTKTILRDLYESYGTRVGRKLLPEIWINAAKLSFDELHQKKTAENPNDISLCVITDVRNYNEFQWIDSIGGQTWYIQRPGFGPAAPKEAESIAHILSTIPRFLDVSPEGLGILNNQSVVALQESVGRRLKPGSHRRSWKAPRRSTESRRRA